MFKAIDPTERHSSKIHPRYLTSACCLISMPLYAIFKDLAFRSLCLVPSNIDCIVNFLSMNQPHMLE